MVADAVDDMYLAEFDHSGAGEFPAFKAVLHTVFFRTGSKSGTAFHAVASYLVRISTVAIFRIVRTGSAEQAADTGRILIGNTHKPTSCSFSIGFYRSIVNFFPQRS